MVILANIPNQAETLLHSLEQAAAGISLHVNAHKRKYMCYNQTGDITTLDRTPLELVDKFTYLGSSVSSTKKDIDTQLFKYTIHKYQDLSKVFWLFTEIYSKADSMYPSKDYHSPIIIQHFISSSVLFSNTFILQILKEWQYRLELPKLCYHPWLAADEDRVSHVLSDVVWWKLQMLKWWIQILKV